MTWQQRAIPSTPQPQADKNNDANNVGSIDEQINFNPSSPVYGGLYDSEVCIFYWSQTICIFLFLFIIFENNLQNWPSKSNPTTSMSQSEKNNADNFNADDILLSTSPKLDWEFAPTSPSFNFPDSEVIRNYIVIEIQFLYCSIIN